MVHVGYQRYLSTFNRPYNFLIFPDLATCPVYRKRGISDLRADRSIFGHLPLANARRRILRSQNATPLQCHAGTAMSAVSTL
jgi:hypothetical protein